jgi:RNA polymerase sigma-70 factor (ECF subfamily)
MTGGGLDRIVRAAGGRVVGALAARFRDLDLAEDAFADACVAALTAWPGAGVPHDPVAWLYRAAERRALDALRRRQVRHRLAPDPPPPEPTAEETMAGDAALIGDERLRLIFVCCHPAVAPEARAALTLRLVCGLSVGEIARAFLLSEAALAQRLTRAKRKIAEAGVPFEVPGPEAWPERLEAVLTTIEVAYAKAHEDAAGAGPHAGYAEEMLGLTRVLAELVPREPEALAVAAIIRFAEARRPARLDREGAMVPLSEQDPTLWRRALIDDGDAYVRRAAALGPAGPRLLQALIHGTWCHRLSLAEPAPWAEALALYDALLAQRDDAVVRLNRAVALAEIAGPAAALAEVEALDSAALANFEPYHAVHADLLRRLGRPAEAVDAYAAALALDPPPAERRWLERRAAACPPCRRGDNRL